MADVEFVTAAVVLSPRAAWHLAIEHHLRHALVVNARRDGRMLSPTVLAALDTLERAAAMYTPARSLVAGPSGPTGRSAMDEECTISTDEAGQRLGVTSKQIRRLLVGGDLSGWRTGRAWRVATQSVDELLELRHRTRKETA